MNPQLTRAQALQLVEQLARDGLLESLPDWLAGALNGSLVEVVKWFVINCDVDTVKNVYGQIGIKLDADDGDAPNAA